MLILKSLLLQTRSLVSKITITTFTFSAFAFIVSVNRTTNVEVDKISELKVSERFKNKLKIIMC